MTQHLLLFTIGPVQTFIAQARKTQDLFAGSKLLSKLIDFAIGKIKTNDNIIFPAENIDSKPNRFLALIDDSQIETAKDLANCVKSRFTCIAQGVFDQQCSGQAKPYNFDKQINNFLDINWVILPYEDKDYQVKYKDIERTLGAVKNVRAFEQLEEQGKKCSLCSERNVLFYRVNSEGKKPAHIQNDAIAIKDNKLNPGEGLCAVCFTKRFYKKQDFPSTAGIALLDKITTDEYKQAFKNNWPNGKYFDEQLLFEENLRAEYLKKYYDVKDNKEAQTLADTVNKIKQESGLDFKTKYYAIIALDGDNMGKWLSGENIKDPNQLKSFHKSLSEKLGTYADQVSKYIDEKDEQGNDKSDKKGFGKRVYAGGDDVLAFVNLNHLTEVLKELRKQFTTIVNNDEEIKKFRKSDENLTVSCGVAIAHYKTPLGVALEKAREMEKKAKKIDEGKDAFGIAVLKHSGEIEETVFKWGNTQKNIELLECLYKKLIQEEFSNTFIKSLNIEFRKLMDENQKIKEERMIEIEMGRLIGRSCMLLKKADESDSDFKERKKKTIEDLSNKLYKLYLDSRNFQNFLSFLNIADFIHREVNKCQ